MGDENLRLAPHKAKDKNEGYPCWWYEEPRGIEVVVSVAAGKFSNITIPWRSIREALARKDKPAPEGK